MHNLCNIVTAEAGETNLCAFLFQKINWWLTWVRSGKHLRTSNCGLAAVGALRSILFKLEPLPRVELRSFRLQCETLPFELQRPESVPPPQAFPSSYLLGRSRRPALTTGLGNRIRLRRKPDSRIRMAQSRGKLSAKEQDSFYAVTVRAMHNDQRKNNQTAAAMPMSPNSEESRRNDMMMNSTITLL